MIWDLIRQVEVAEPMLYKVQTDLFTQSPSGSNAKAISHQQHPDQQLGANRRATRVAVELG